MTAPTTPNAELAYRVLDHIDAHAERWNQGVWIGQGECGTSACFAGWACLLAGDQAVYDDESDDETDSVAVRGGDLMVPERAAELLGIPYDGTVYGHELFHAGHDRGSLGCLVAEIFGPRPGGAS